MKELERLTMTTYLYCYTDYNEYKIKSTNSLLFLNQLFQSSVFKMVYIINLDLAINLRADDNTESYPTDKTSLFEYELTQKYVLDYNKDLFR